MGPVELVAEASNALVVRPARTVMTILGTVLGVAALVATLGMSQTAGGQILASFDELRATEVTVTPQSTGVGDSEVRAYIPWNVENRLDRLNGVRAAGARAKVDIATAEVRASVIRDPSAAAAAAPKVVAASPGLLPAIRGTLASGRWFDLGHSERADRVAVLGRAAAERLGVARLDRQPAILIGDESYLVIGILESVDRERDLLGAVMIPSGTAVDRFGSGSPDKVVIDTAIGAPELIRKQAPIALSPNHPEQLRAQRPTEPEGARARVSRDVDTLFLVLGLVSLSIGALGIANITLVSVLERVGEIGLRRALGATRGEITLQFLAESGATGLLGGILGTLFGLGVVVVVSLVRQWNPIIDSAIPLGAPVVGLLVGLVAGIYPALRAARLQPVDALRSG